MHFVLALAFGDPAEFCELARSADECGWGSVSVSDHVVHFEKLESPYPYTADGSIRWDASTPWADPLVAIGAMAAVTERVRFLTSIFVLPMRSPFLVAKAVATAAVISGGRVDLGIGVGWMREEFELLGAEFGGRGRRADEMVELMRRLWTGETVEGTGPEFEFPRLSMQPAAGPVPILAGGLSEPALRRAARLDGWISDLTTADELREITAKLRRYRAEAGREGEPLEIVAASRDAFDADGFRRLGEAGATRAMMLPWVLYGRPPYSLDDKRDGIRRFADEVIAKLG